MGLGNCADPLTELFQERQPEHPFLGGLMKRCLVIKECWGLDSWAWTQRPPSKTFLTPPSAYTLQKTEFTLVSDNNSIENCSQQTPGLWSFVIAQNYCTSAQANSYFLCHTYLCHLSTPYTLMFPLLFWQCMFSDMYSYDFYLTIVYIMKNPKSASPCLISPINF